MAQEIIPDRNEISEKPFDLKLIEALYQAALKEFDTPITRDEFVAVGDEFFIRLYQPGFEYLSRNFIDVLAEFDSWLAERLGVKVDKF